MSSSLPASARMHGNPVRRCCRRIARFGMAGALALAVIVFWMLAALFGTQWIGHANVITGDVFAPISATHWLGTDFLGRDVVGLVIDGARYTVGLAVVATLLASGCGTLLGLLAAVSGRWIDSLLSRTLDTLTSIPSTMFALLMVAGFGSSVPVLIATAAINYVPGAYRIARSLAVNTNALDYVTVARARGEGALYVMLREILPNIAEPILADLGLRFVYVVLLLASLSFLGLGIQPPAADWGSLVRENIGSLAYGSPAVIAPALAIASLTIAVNVVIDRLPSRAAREKEVR